jgi:hypothetical protein
LTGKALFNTAISIQIHAASEKDRRSSIESEQMDGYDPGEFAITLSIETSQNNKGILFRHCSDMFPDDEARIIASTMTSISERFIDDPGNSVAVDTQSSLLLNAKEERKPSQPSASLSNPLEPQS